MWLLQPAKGRTAIRKVWRDWLRSVPDYQIDVIDCASQPETNDAFVMWRASGVAKLSLIPQRPTTNKPFEHYGVTRSAAAAVGNRRNSSSRNRPDNSGAEQLGSRELSPISCSFCCCCSSLTQAALRPRVGSHH